MKTNYITAVFKLPENEEQARSVCRALALGHDFLGGTVTAAYSGDAISENEVFERNADPRLVKSVRDEVAALWLESCATTPPT